MRKRIALLLHAVIFVSTTWAIVDYFFIGPDVLGGVGTECFRYFTTDSNILAAIGSLVYLVCMCVRGKNGIPGWARVLRFAGTVSVTVTLLTVLFFLVPMAMKNGRGIQAALQFFEGNVFVLHLSTPVLSIAALLIPAQEDGITLRESLWGVAPVAVYSVVYGSQVLLGRWNDWYGFTFGGHNELIPVVALVMYAFTAGLSLLEWKLSKLIASRAAGRD